MMTVAPGQDFSILKGSIKASRKNALIGIIISLILPVITFVPSSSSLAEICDCESEIRNQVSSFNEACCLSVAERYESLERHLPRGIPVNPSNSINETLLILRNYVLNYDADLNASTWAAYRLTETDVDDSRPGYVSRLECFRNYPAELHPNSTPPLCSDYDRDTSDLGHIVNSNDMRRCKTANANTFFLVNMAPQYSNFNQKIWRTPESRVHSLAQSKKEIFVVTGAVFDTDGDGKRCGDNETDRNDCDGQIAVASHFYKIILRSRADGLLDALTILLPHNNQSITGEASRAYLTEHITTIYEIEKLTGIKFLPELEAESASKAVAVKGHRAKVLWW